MIRNPHKIRPYRHRTRSLIATHRIKPERLYLSEVEALTTLRANGCGVRQIKQIRLLRHQVCISYWNEQGGVCSGFFSYRMFKCWEMAVEELIDSCSTLKTWQVLNWVMRSELTYYPYPVEISMNLSQSLQQRLSELETPVAIASMLK